MSRDIFEMVRELDIVEIIERYIDIENKQGDEYNALCPFHPDKRLGNFKINSKKGIFKCFSCGVGGDAIEFVSLYKNISRLEAASEIAYYKGLISIFDYNEYINNNKLTQHKIRKGKSDVKKYKNRNLKYILGEIEFKASDEELDRAYNIFLDDLKLNEKHREYLVDIRDIPINIIEKRKYKTYPTHNEMKSIFNKIYREHGDLNSIFRGVPGFFKQKVNNKWEWRAVYNEGIIIPIRNARGQIIALQIRVDREKNSGVRYNWFSSSQHIYTNNARYGVSSGVPLDVIYPEKRPNNILFITEGRFKSEAIASKIGSVCISVQGIGNWTGIEREIYVAEDYLKQRYKGYMGFTRIYIAFDMDIYENLHKYKQLEEMSDSIQSEFPTKEIYCIQWESKFKGIDDLILNNKQSRPEDYGKLFKLVDKK